MTSAVDFATSVCALAQREATLSDFRRGVLELLGKEVAYERALFHELSPRSPLERAAVVGFEPSVLVASSAAWDETAVALGRLRDVALEHGGVSSDLEAFPVGSKGRKEWQRRVEKPLGVRHLAIVHLLFHGRIVSAVLLFRRRPFAERELEKLRRFAPALSVADAACQAALGPAQGLRVRLECNDQRLTERQRDLVVRVALGHTNREIAAALGLSENTVRNALVSVRNRLGASNRADIVRLAVLR